MFKQYERKPWKQAPEPPKDSKDTTPKEKQPRKPMLPGNQRTKWNLVKAMGKDHPLRTLDIGTVNANATRAANRTTHPVTTNRKKLLEEINTSLSKVAEHATTVKRTAQLAVGQYLEDLSMRQLDAKDRVILNHLCPQYSVQEKAEIRKGLIADLLEAEESRGNINDDPDDDPGNSNKDVSGNFFRLLLTSLYNKEDTSGTSTGAEAVRFFLEKARANKFLPPVPRRSRFLLYYCFYFNIIVLFTLTSTNDLFYIFFKKNHAIAPRSLAFYQDKKAMDKYPGSTVVRSTAMRMLVEYKRHFKAGSFLLVKEVITTFPKLLREMERLLVWSSNTVAFITTDHCAIDCGPKEERSSTRKHS